jgi:hypothetical protein
MPSSCDQRLRAQPACDAFDHPQAPAYYWRDGTGNGSKSAILFMEGGGWCYPSDDQQTTGANCAVRAKSGPFPAVFSRAFRAHFRVIFAVFSCGFADFSCNLPLSIFCHFCTGLGSSSGYAPSIVRPFSTFCRQILRCL